MTVAVFVSLCQFINLGKVSILCEQHLYTLGALVLVQFICICLSTQNILCILQFMVHFLKPAKWVIMYFGEVQ